MNLKQFARRMEGRASQLEENANSLKKDVAILLVTELGETTPVDTGNAVSNWQVGLGAPVGNERTPHSPGNKGSTQQANVRATIAEAAMVIDTALPNENIHITNNTDYIRDLDRGTSAQARTGMTKAAKAKAKALIKRGQLTGRKYVRQY